MHKHNPRELRQLFPTSNLQMLNRLSNMVLLAIALSLVLTACADLKPTTTTLSEPDTATTAPDPDILKDPELSALCGAVELSGGPNPVLPSTPIDSDGDAALAVIEKVAAGEAQFFEQYEWFVADSTEDRLVLFGAPIGETAEEAPPYAYATFQRDGDTWRPEGWGQCRVEVSSPGYGVAHWVLDPESDPASSGRQLHVLINERQCASGEPPLGREIVPVVLEESTTIAITVLVEPVDGPAECPSNPWHPITIDLSEPVGIRHVFDSSVAPPLERYWPPSQEVLDSLGAQP